MRSVAESAVESAGGSDGWGTVGSTHRELYAGASAGGGDESVWGARATGVVDAS
jgi:hypothetical protein